MISRDVTITNRLGLHARASAKLVALASRYQARVKLRNGDNEADAKSILGVLMLAGRTGDILTLSADGADESESVDAIQQLIAAKFDEVE